MQSSENNFQRAFTLTEVMVALTLLGLIATLLASGTRLGLDISARGNAKAEALRTEQVGRELLRRQLQSALPYRYSIEIDGKPIELVAFEGEAERIRFVSRQGILDGPDALPRWIDFRGQNLPNRQSELVIEERRILSPNNQPAGAVTARVQIPNCAEVHFEYLDTTEETPKWLSAWSGLARNAPLPFAVRMECKIASGSIKTLIPLEYAESARQGWRIQ